MNHSFHHSICAALFLGVSSCIGSVSVFAQNIPVATFEMDGNVVVDSTIDWESPPDTNNGALAYSGIVTDTQDRTFKKGSKDTQDVSQWNWDFFNTVTPKDDIQHAYATAFATAEGNILYFGLDRLAGSSGGGTTSFGFWAFGDNVTLVDPTGGTSDEFNGNHKDGDILVTGEIGGNTIIGIRVFVWEGDGLSGSLVEVTPGGAADCSLATISAGAYQTAACGEVNSSPITPSWIGSPIEAGRFVEIAVNYEAATGRDLPCFSSFMATTRTSTSERASIKNFTSGSFPLCHIAVSKVCNVAELVSAGDATTDPVYRIEFTATVLNDGAASFASSENITVTDAAGTVFGDSNDVTVTRTVSDLTGPTYMGVTGDGSDGFQHNEKLDVLASGMTITGSYTSNINGGMDSVKASITNGTQTINSETYTTSCTPLALNPALYIDKECDPVKLVNASGGGLGVQVPYDIHACNTGDLPLNVAITDPTATVSVSETLSNGLPCGPVSGATCPAGSTCVGSTASTDGVCVSGDDETGPDGAGGSLTVCDRITGNYVVTSVSSDTAPYSETLSNTAKVTASEANNPAIDVTTGDDSIMSSDSATCPLCDADGDHYPDYTDAYPQDETQH